jgi:hypothetical protein
MNIKYFLLPLSFMFAISTLKAQAIPPAFIWGNISGVYQEGDSVTAGLDINNNGILDTVGANTSDGSEIFVYSQVQDLQYGFAFPADNVLTSIIEGGLSGDSIVVYINERRARPNPIWQSGLSQQDVSLDVLSNTINSSLPEGFVLSQNYPNPFNPLTNIDFAIPYTSNVNLSIFNINGQKIDELVDGFLSAGNYRFTWNPTNVSSGVYLYKAEFDQHSLTGKMVYSK